MVLALLLSSAPTPGAFVRQVDGKPPGDLLRALVTLYPAAETIGALVAHFGYHTHEATATGTPGAPEDARAPTPTVTRPRERRPIVSGLAALVPETDDAATDRAPVWVDYVTPLSVQRSQPVYRRPIEPLFDPSLSRALLTGAAARSTHSGEVDLAALVALIARGTPPKALPRRRVTSLGQRVQLLLDIGPAMEPFSGDLRQLIDATIRFVGLDRLQLARFRGCPTDGLETSNGESVAPYKLPAPGDCVLAVTTLGVETLAGGASVADWVVFAEKLAQQDCAFTAIVPYPLDRIPRELTSRLRVLSWDRSTGVRDLTRRSAHRKTTGAGASIAPADAAVSDLDAILARIPSAALGLAQRACLAARAEPQLLRVLRLKVAPPLDVAAETDLFWSEAVEVRGKAGVVLREELLPRLRQRLKASPDLLDACWEATRALHQDGSRAIFYEEELTYLTLRGLDDPARSRRVEDILRQLVVSLLPRSGVQLALWGERAVLRLPAELFVRFEEARMLATGLGPRIAARVLAKLPARQRAGTYRWLGAGGAAMTEYYARLVDGGIEFSPRPLPASHEIAVPDASVVQAELHWNERGGARRRIVGFDRTRTEFVEIDADELEIDIYVFGGSSYRLRRHIERAPGTQIRVHLSAVTSEFGKARDAIAADLRARDAVVAVSSDFRPGGDADTLLERLHDHIRDCDAVVVLLGKRSGAFPPPRAAAPFEKMLPRGISEASYVQWEWIFARYYRRRLYTYLAADDYVPDTAPASGPDVPGKQANFIAYLKAEGVYWSTFANAAEVRIAVLREAWPQARAQTPERPKPAVKPIILPYPSLGPLFNGRERFMQQLRETLARGERRRAVAIGALYGLAGIGKTRAAVEYAWAHVDDYTALLFVVAETPEGLRRNLAALSSTLMPGLDTSDDAVRLQATFDWLRTNPGWLLILDNVDSQNAMNDVERLMPELAGGDILITTRLADFSASVEPLSLDALPLDDAAAFLLARTRGRRREARDDSVQARTLAQELGQHPLSLEHAGAYISKHRLTFSQYLANWRTNRDAVMAWQDRTVTGYPRGLAITLATSLEQLSKAGHRLLDALAWFGTEKIPELLLDVPMPAFENENLHDALAEIAGYSLVTRDAEGPYFLVHRLVQDTARRAMTQQAESQRTAVLWMDAAFTGDPADVRNWPRLEALAPHAHVLVLQSDPKGIEEPIADLMSRLGGLYEAKAMYNEAEPLFKRALEIAERAQDDRQVVPILNNLSSLLYDTGRLAEAEPLTRRALAIVERANGPDHPNMAVVLNNLAMLLRSTSRHAEAEPLLRRALAIREKSLGPEHPAVANNLVNLALLFRDEGRLDEAEELVHRALAINEKSLGVDHPASAISLGVLASILMASGQFDEAEPLLQRALAVQERNLGPEHPDVANSLVNLASLLRRTGRLDEAEALLRRAVAINEAILGSVGSQHPGATRAQVDLAELLALKRPPN